MLLRVKKKKKRKWSYLDDLWKQKQFYISNVPEKKQKQKAPKHKLPTGSTPPSKTPLTTTMLVCRMQK